MPRDVPQSNFIECKSFGAKVTLVDGLISDCAKIVAARKDEEGWFDISTLKEPYRIEGKKTMGLELAEQRKWRLPDVILYPTGGGTGRAVTDPGATLGRHMSRGGSEAADQAATRCARVRGPPGVQPSSSVPFPFARSCCVWC